MTVKELRDALVAIPDDTPAYVLSPKPGTFYAEFEVTRIKLTRSTTDRERYPNVLAIFTGSLMNRDSLGGY